MRALTALLAAAGLLLAGCGGEGEKRAQEEATASAPSSSSLPASTTPSTTGVEDASFQLALELCTDGLREPDTLIGDAIDAARAGTRSTAEIADAFRQGQDAVEALAARAEDGGLEGLSQAFQDYADVLGRARVSGDAGLDEMADTREAINLACLTSSYES